MTVHLVKIAVGAESVEDIAEFQKQRRAKLKAERGKPILIHKTRNMPKRESEIIKTGSIPSWCAPCRSPISRSRAGVTWKWMRCRPI